MINEKYSKYFNSKNIMCLLFVIALIFFTILWKNIAIMFFASFVIACSLNPVVDKMENKMSRSMASSIVMFVFISTILAIFIPVCIILAEEIKTFAVSFPQYVDTLDEYLLSSPMLSKFDFSPIDFDALAQSASNYSSDIISYILDIGKYIGTACMYILVSIIITFNILVDKSVLKNFYLDLFPTEFRPTVENIGNIIAEKMGHYLIALVATMTSVGIVMLIGLYLFKVDYALILSLITAVLDIIPVIGPGLALIICLIMTYKLGIGAIIAVIAVFATTQLIENNFVRPFVFGKFLDLHPLVIFLFLFIAAETMGVVGVIFAPAVAVLFSVLFKELYIKNVK